MAFVCASSMIERLHEIIGDGNITILLDEVGRYADIADGSRIAAVTAVISAGGRQGGAQLMASLDSAAAALENYQGEDFLKISSCFPTVLRRSDSDGFMRFEKKIEMIFCIGRGDAFDNQ